MSYCVVAFSGNLPVHVIDVLRFYENFKVVSVGNTVCAQQADLIIQIGQVSKLLKFLKTNTIKKILLVGALERPELWKINLDFKGIVWAWHLRNVVKKGDNELLEVIIRLFSKEGVKVCSLLEVDLLRNVLFLHNDTKSIASPTAVNLEDIKRGVQILNVMSDLDVAQSVVVQNGIVLGIECIDGTESLIKRCAGIKQPVGKPVLIKIPKIGQTLKLDMPTIGPDTIEQLHNAGFAGVAIDFSHCIVIDSTTVLEKLNKYKIFIENIIE